MCSILFLVSGKKVNCTYAYIDDINKWQQYNVRDNTPGFVPQSPNQIASNLEERYHNCGDYSVLRNNCEHLVTWLRYRNKVSKQVGFHLELNVYKPFTFILLCVSVNLKGLQYSPWQPVLNSSLKMETRLIIVIGL